MPYDDHPPPNPAALSPSEKADWTTEKADAFALHHYHKICANEREVHKMETSQFLQLPQEILENIYEHVYEDRVFKLCKSPGGKARLADASSHPPFALRSTCRKLRQDTAKYPFSKTTFKIVTYKFMSMIHSKNVAIRYDPNILIDFLLSVPAPASSIDHIEVVGVEGNPLVSWMASDSWVRGHESGVDYKAELEEYIRIIYPEAKITFRTVEHDGQF